MPPRRPAASRTSRTGKTSRAGRTLNEAARITARLQTAGLTKADVARVLGRDPSLVSQFTTHNKGAAFVAALTQVERAVAGGITDREELAAIAAPHITRRTTASGTRARVRSKALLITPTGTGTGRVAAQAIASGSARLRPLIAQAARLGLRLAFTVRLAESGFVHPSGSRTDSPGIRRGVIQRADRTEERSYGSAQTGGFDAAEFAARVDAAGGDVTTAVHAFLVATGRIHPGARITHLEIRTWRAR